MTKGKVTPRQVVCVGCSVSFVSDAPRAKYCSRKCLDKIRWDKNHRKEVKCKECGETVTRNYSRSFCSDECKIKHYGSSGASGRSWYLKNTYNLTIEQFDALVEKQDGKCAICRKEYHKTWQIDHDHGCCPTKRNTCGKCVRGLLCADCNSGLGRFKDNPEYLRAAADYLESFIV